MCSRNSREPRVISRVSLLILYIEAADLADCGEDERKADAVLEQLDVLLCTHIPLIAVESTAAMSDGCQTRRDATFDAACRELGYWPSNR